MTFPHPSKELRHGSCTTELASIPTNDAVTAPRRRRLAVRLAQPVRPGPGRCSHGCGASHCAALRGPGCVLVAQRQGARVWRRQSEADGVSMRHAKQ